MIQKTTREKTIFVEVPSETCCGGYLVFVTQQQVLNNFARQIQALGA